VKDYLSFSAVNTYQLCPECYRLKYIAELVREERPVAFQFGSDVHEMLAQIWDRGKANIPNFDYMKDPDTSRKLALDLVEKGKNTLFEEQPVGGWGPPIMLDPYAVKDGIGLETELEISIKGFKGIIDLLGWSVNGKLWVIDWKTTSVEYTPHDILSSDQLTCYAWLTEKQFGRLPDYVAFITLNKKTGESHIWASTRSQQQIIDWQRKVESIREDIKKKHFWKNPTSCEQPWGDCEYYKLCWKREPNPQVFFETELPKFGGGTVKNGLRHED
jgi:hypothetical protein